MLRVKSARWPARWPWVAGLALHAALVVGCSEERPPFFQRPGAESGETGSMTFGVDGEGTLGPRELPEPGPGGGDDDDVRPGEGDRDGDVDERDVGDGDRDGVEDDAGAEDEVADESDGGVTWRFNSSGARAA